MQIFSQFIDKEDYYPSPNTKNIINNLKKELAKIENELQVAENARCCKNIEYDDLRKDIRMIEDIIENLESEKDEIEREKDDKNNEIQDFSFPFHQPSQMIPFFFHCFFYKKIEI